MTATDEEFEHQMKTAGKVMQKDFWVLRALAETDRDGQVSEETRVNMGKADEKDLSTK